MQDTSRNSRTTVVWGPDKANALVSGRNGHYGRALEEALQSNRGQWPLSWKNVNPLHGGRTFNNMEPSERVCLRMSTTIHRRYANNNTARSPSRPRHVVTPRIRSNQRNHKRRLQAIATDRRPERTTVSATVGQRRAQATLLAG